MEPHTKNLAERPHILVVDDDARIRALVSRYLRGNGFVACTATDAAQADAVLDSLSFDALVVDVMMPGRSGLDFTRALRAHSAVPVLLLTALGEAADRIAGLETGADDYLPKPFEPRELVLRLRAILRRAPGEQASAAENASLRIGRWLYDPHEQALCDGADEIRLTAVEDTLLRALAGRAGQPVNRADLAALCGPDAGERTIDVQVARLRRKIEDDPRHPRLLQTVRGTGYRLRTGGA